MIGRFFVAVAVAVMLGTTALPARAASSDSESRAEMKAQAAKIKEAAEAGDVKAQTALGLLYALGGHGVRKSYKDAAKWWEQAASHGDARAEHFLGVLYLNGKGEPRDVDQAIKLLRQSAAQGDGAAMAVLGELYLFGDGVDKNLKTAIEWFQKAVQAGDPEGEFRLGMARLSGEGLAKDPREGGRLLRSAAEQGNEGAMMMMAVLLSRGEAGMPRDPVEAYTWALRAQSLKVKKAAKLADTLAGSLTPQQRAAAEAKAAGWKPQRAEGAEAMPSPHGEPREEEGDEASSGDEGPPAGRPGQAPAAAGDGKPRLVATGSGFYVSGDGHLVTNHHVIAGCTKLEAGTEAGGMAEARPVADDPGNDLAVLQVKAKPPAVATLRSGPVRQAEAVMAYGFPLTGALSSSGNATTGAITALTGLQDDSRFYQTSAPVQPGNSGGPLVDMGARVVGVVDAKLDALRVAQVTHDIPQNVNFAIKVAVLTNFLDSHGIRYGMASADGSAKSAPDISDAARAFTALVTCWK